MEQKISSNFRHKRESFSFPICCSKAIQSSKTFCKQFFSLRLRIFKLYCSKLSLPKRSFRKMVQIRLFIPKVSPFSERKTFRFSPLQRRKTLSSICLHSIFSALKTWNARCGDGIKRVIYRSRSGNVFAQTILKVCALKRIFQKLLPRTGTKLDRAERGSPRMDLRRLALYFFAWTLKIKSLASENFVLTFIGKIPKLNFSFDLMT